MSREKGGILKSIDRTSVLIYVVLVLIGWFNIYSATYNEAHSSIFDLSQRYGMQLIWILFGFLLAFLILIFDSEIYSVAAMPIYVISMVILASVLVVGVEINGSKSWLAFGTVRFQPAELAKVATSLALAYTMSQYGFHLNKNYLKIIVLIAIPVGLIFLQHDTGSAIVFSSFLIMLYREGLSGWVLIALVYLVVLFIASLVLEPFTVIVSLVVISLIIYAVTTDRVKYTFISTLVLIALYLIVSFIVNEANIRVKREYLFLLCCVPLVIWMFIINHKRLSKAFLPLMFFALSFGISSTVDYSFDKFLKPHQKDRIEDLLGIKVDLKKAGYNVHQSKIAIGSGGLLGRGFLEGTQTKYNFVPEQSTDFIFCTIGEEWGFVGSAIIIVFYLILLWRIVLISERQRYTFGRVYGYCVAGILFFHVVINIGMTIGLMPVIGIPLPFISYGGSSLWSFTILLFILLKIDTYREA